MTPSLRAELRDLRNQSAALELILSKLDTAALTQVYSICEEQCDPGDDNGIGACLYSLMFQVEDEMENRREAAEKAAEEKLFAHFQ